MKNIKFKALSIIIIACLISCFFTVSISASLVEGTAFEVVLSGEEYVIKGEKFVLGVSIGNFSEKEFLGATLEIDYDASVLEVSSEYWDNVNKNEAYPIKNGEDGWVCWISDSVNEKNGVFTIHVLNDSASITSLKGDSIECFVEFNVKETEISNSTIKIDTDSALIGTFSKTEINSKLGTGSEISFDVLDDKPETLRKLVLKEESSLYVEKSVISELEVLTGVTEATKVSDFLSNFKNNLENLSVSQNGNVLSDSDYIGTNSTISLIVDNETVDSLLIVVLGDVNGSCEVDATDYLLIKNHFLKRNSPLEACALSAADIDASGEIDATDYVRLKSYFLDMIDIYA